MKKKNKHKKNNPLDFTDSIFANGGQSVPVALFSGCKTPTTCCALAIYSFRDCLSNAELEYFIQRQTEEAKIQWQSWSRASGETCMMVVTTPDEPELARKLAAHGFKNVWQFNRRNGYPQNGQLKLWTLNVARPSFRLSNDLSTRTLPLSAEEGAGV